MKKKLLILSACIGLILACFPFTLYAEEDPESDIGISPPPANYQLDSYFYDNYILLPYIESDRNQYIDTGVSSRSNLRIDISLSDLSTAYTQGLFGSYSSNNGLYIEYGNSSGNSIFKFASGSYSYSVSYVPYQMYNFTFDKNKVYLNYELLHEFTDSTFDTNRNMSIFALTGSTVQEKSIYKLYRFSIYDYSADSGNGAYVRYYYPAKSKSGSVIGLYDAISKTFVTTGGSVPFNSPDGTDFEMSIYSKITNFIFSSLDWVSDILGFAISEPVIILFMAIGLAGAMFRWGRRLIHF